MKDYVNNLASSTRNKLIPYDIAALEREREQHSPSSPCVPETPLSSRSQSLSIRIFLRKRETYGLLGCWPACRALA
jgi:hypothetical protein